MLEFMVDVLRIVHWAVYSDAAEIGHEASLAEYWEGEGYASEAYNDHLRYLSENPFYVKVMVHYNGNPEFWPNGRVVMGEVEYIK